MKVDTSFSVVFAKSAALDLRAIYNYIAEDSEIKAVKIIQTLESRINKLVTFPEQGRVSPELENFNILIYREIVEYPWRIFYKIEQRTILIIAILDGRRNIEDLLMQRLLR